MRRKPNHKNRWRAVFTRLFVFVFATTAIDSAVTASGNLSIVATGANKESNISALGSNLNAGHDANLIADNQINLVVADR